MMKETLLKWAETVAATSDRLRIALNEEDNSTDPQPEAAHFFKMDEERLGRDLELYAFMSQIQGQGATLCDLAIEIAFPLRDSIPAAHERCKEFLAAQGRHIFDKERQAEWIESLA